MKSISKPAASKVKPDPNVFLAKLTFTEGLLKPEALQVDFSVCHALASIGRLAMADHRRVGDFVTEIAGLFESMSSCVLYLKSPLNDHNGKALKRKALFSKNLQVQESARPFVFAISTESPIGDAYSTKKVIFIDHLGGFKIVFDDLDPYNTSGLVTPAIVDPSKGMEAVVPVFYRSVTDLAGVIVLRGDLTCAGSSLSDFCRTFWSARAAVSVSTQISQQYLLRLDETTGLQAKKDFYIDAKDKIRRILEDSSIRCALILADIDHFKKINTDFGYLAADAILFRVAQMMKATLRTNDMTYRWGGEELVALADVPNRDTAIVIAERIRSAIGRIVATDEKRLQSNRNVTCSIGVVELFDAISQLKAKLIGMDMDTAVDFILREVFDQVNSALSRAKDEGRNRVYYCKKKD